MPERTEALERPARATPPPRGARTRVLVVGAGPAGLAAASRLLERGGRDRFRVRLATLGHHVGGKASSWRDAEGRLIDHGLHVTAGFYREMKALLARAGVDVEASLVSNEGHTYVYEERDGQVHDLALKRNPLQVLLSSATYSGFTPREKAATTRFVLGSLATWLGGQSLEQFDDVCFTTWALENGLPASAVRTNAFKMSRQAQLNWPGEISAYSILAAIRVLARDYRTSEYGFCDGGMSERFWGPVLRHIIELGGEFEPMRDLVAIHPEAGRAAALTFAAPSSGGHETRDPNRATFEGPVEPKPGSAQIDRAFDQLILTLPVGSVQQLNPGDAALWELPEFARLRKLRSVAPLALQIWHRAPVTHRYESVIAGLGDPLPFVLDVKHVIREYRFNPRYGSVLYFVGQEAGHADWEPERLLRHCLDSLRPLPGFEPLVASGREGVLHFQVVRNRGPHQRYFLTDPGTLGFRPHMRGSLSNLLFAGDWVRSELDFPCMEAAVRSGLAAADAVLAEAT